MIRYKITYRSGKSLIVGAPNINYIFRGYDLSDCIKIEEIIEYLECKIHSFPMNENGVCFKCGAEKPERPKASHVMHERMTGKELNEISKNP